MKAEKTTHHPTAAPFLGQRAPEIQRFGTHLNLPNGLNDTVIERSIEGLNHVLVDTMVIRDLYKKHHWQVSGATFYQLHLLFDKHYEEQLELIDKLAERIQSLGGLSVAMAHDVVEMSNIDRPPRGREEPPVQISRLLDAHEIILNEAHKFAEISQKGGDDGTNDLLVSDIIRTNELQVWFLSEHLVNTPTVIA